MKEWQFNILFGVVVIGILAMFFAKPLGLDIPNEAFTVFGLVVSFVLTQRKREKKTEKTEDKDQEEHHG